MRSRTRTTRHHRGDHRRQDDDAGCHQQWLVLISPLASPDSDSAMPSTALTVSETNVAASPTPTRSDGRAELAELGAESA